MRRSLAVVVLALAAVAVPPSAQAGGPTSVIVTNPASGEASALYYTDGLYDELETLLAAGTPVADPPPDASAASSFNLTWLLHDVSPWRVDRVYFDVEGGPWVATTQSLADAITGDEHATWRQIPDGKELSMLLEGLLGGSSATDSEQVTTPEPLERVVEVARTETTWFSLAGWRWVGPGLLLGLGVGLVVARRSGRDDHPRQVLMDRGTEAGAGMAASAPS